MLSIILKKNIQCLKIVIMKKKNLMLCIVLIVIGATAFKIADDIIAKLGMKYQDAQANIINNLVGNFSTGAMELGEEDDNDRAIYIQMKSFKMPYVPMLANVIQGDKAAAAKDLCDYVKRYINSEEFITDYNNRREEVMPLSYKGSSLTSLKKNKIMYGKNMTNYKTDTKYVAAQQKLSDENQKEIDALIELSKKPFEGKDVWEKAYPADPVGLVKKRLQEYLTLVATVDFTAKLTEPKKYERKKFINPAYEKKSLKWKATYRAGKDVNDVVTAFVKDWLKGEIIATQKIKMTEKTSIETNNNQSKTTPVNTSGAKTNTNQNTPVKVNTPATNVTDSAATPDKKKKSIFNKIKNKTMGVIKN